LPTIYAKTERLVLRKLEKDELPRFVECLNVWSIARWLAVVPFPYTMRDAKDYFADMEQADKIGAPEFYGIALKSDDLLIGGVGLHIPRGTTRIEGDLEIGYWLSEDRWGQGIMTEAAREVAAIGFARPATRALVSTTDAKNMASQNVLQKIGMQNLGIMLRDYSALRGDDKVVKWQMTRKEWESFCAA